MTSGDASGAGVHSSRPRACAMAAASVRPAAPSLARTRETWTLTVLVLLRSLVKAPDWLIDLAAFGHVPVSGIVAAQAILLLVGVVATFGAALLVSRRDLAA